MKRILLLFLLALPCFAQTTGNITTSGTTCATTNACVTQQLSASSASAGVTISGTWSATLQFEVSNDNGTTWVAVNATPPNSTSAVTSTTANGTWRINVSGMTNVHVRASALASGTAQVTITFGSGSASTGSGGGTTINSTNNVLPKRASAAAFTDSAVTDDGVTVTSTLPIVAPSASTGTAPTACGSATGCVGATAASTASTQTAGQGSQRLDSTTGWWFDRNVNGANEAKHNTAKTSTCGGSCSLASADGPAQIVQCTASCTITPLAPAADVQLIVYMKPGVTGTITLVALGGSAKYGKCDGTAYGTAGTGTLAIASAQGNRVGLSSVDTTNYDCLSSQGTVTIN